MSDEQQLSDEQQKLIEKREWEEEEIERVKAKYKVEKVYMLKVPVDDQYKEFVYGFIKYPSRTHVSIAMTMEETDPLKGKEIVLRNSWLEGDQRILNDDELFYSACTVLDQVIGIRKAILKKN